MSVTELEMQAADVPRIKTEKELVKYVRALVERQHDYGTCVYAMSMAATATFNYVASKLGVTGFQAACADMDILRRTRRLKGPFMLVDGEKALFPQYNLRAEVEKFTVEIAPWLAEQAAKKLAETTSAHPEVVAHWRTLAARTQAERHDTTKDDGR